MTGLRNATILSLLVSTMFFGTACGGTQAAPGKDGGTTHSDGGGGTDGGTQQPTVTISAPASGASYAAGAPITFTGSATDPVDGALTGNALSWTSDKEGSLGFGASVTTALATVGSQTITLTATDSAGHSASASIKLTVTASNVPQVVITSPQDGHQAAIGEPINFTATVTPPTGATVSNANIVWTSSLDGQIGIGATVRTGLATAGAHTITCTATDSNGNSGTATITVNIVNHVAPKVTINTPADNSYYRPTDSINFTGSVTAAAGSTITPTSIVWTDETGTIVGRSATVTTALTALGKHTITLSATDNTGAVGSASITVTIVTNLPPVCTISRPLANSTFLVGQSINFIGNCTDPDSGQAPTNLTWSTDVDGTVGHGATVANALASPGDRAVTLCATDPVDPTLTGCSAPVTIHVKANTPPTCTITAPANGAIVQVGDRVLLSGTVTDAEDPSITGLNPTATWYDQANKLGSQAQMYTVFPPAQAGARTLTLTGTDSGGLTCTATVSIVVNQRPTDQITSVSQNNSSNPPFVSTAPVDFTGTGSDPDGNTLTFTWKDSFAGTFGSGTAGSLTSPIPGHHTVYFVADDGYGGLATATTSFTVMPPNGTTLIQPLGAYNGTVNDLRTLSLATDSTGFLSVGNQSAEVWRQDGLSPATPPTLNYPRLLDNANTIVIDEANGRAYIGTQGSGYYVCNYSTTGNPPTTPAGIDPTSCTNSYRGNQMPADWVYAVAALTDANGNQVLVVGTRRGLFIPDSFNGSNRGVTYLDGRDIRGIAVDGTNIWVATNGNGLYEIDPSKFASGNFILGHWRAADGAPSDNLFAVTLGTQGDAVWVGSDNGLGRYTKSLDSWSTWQQNGVPAPGVANNQVNAIAVDHPVIGGLARDVIWVATSGGVSRFDPTIPSFMNFTQADGLPSNQVNAVVVLPNGTKVFGTQNGLAQYTGQ